MRTISLLLLIFQFSSCCKTESNHDNLKKVRAEEHYVNLRTLSQEMASYKLPDLVKPGSINDIFPKRSLRYFYNEIYANQIFKAADTTAFIHNFDFNRFIILPFANVQDMGQGGLMEFQAYGVINHKNKEVIFTINVSRTYCQTSSNK